MKNVKTLNYAIALFAIAAALTACQKGSASLSDTLTGAAKSGSSSIAATTGDILIASSVNTATTTTAASVTKDSVFLMHACPPGKRPDTVAFSALSAAITTYLTANYAGYNFQKAFKVHDKAGNADGYVVAINYNSKPVGLKFDVSGTFTNLPVVINTYLTTT